MRPLQVVCIVLSALVCGSAGGGAGTSFTPNPPLVRGVAAATLRHRIGQDPRPATAQWSWQGVSRGPSRHPVAMHMQGQEQFALVKDEAMDELLVAAYPSSTDGFCTSEEEDAAIGKVGGENAHTYGEITAKGLRRLCRRFNLGRDDVFMDMGSGVGKAVIQAKLEFGAARSTGVELSESRHRNAIKGVRNLAAEITARGLQTARFQPPPPPPAFASEPDVVECGAGVKLVRGDVMTCDISEATVMYVASLCFSDEFMSALGRKLSSEGGRLRAVASLKRFEEGLPGLRECDAEEERYEMSWLAAWDMTTPVWVYVKE